MIKNWIFPTPVRLFFGIAFVYLQQSAYSQTGCAETFVKILGSTSGDEKGYALAASETERVVYASGTINDSFMIVRIRETGEIDWARKIELFKGKHVYINGMILDAEGKLGIAGTIGELDDQGNVFVCRYDPAVNSLLWSKEMMSTSMGFTSGIFEMGPGGNYLLSNNPSSPNNAELVLLDKSNGAIQPAFAKHYNLGGPETIAEVVLYNGGLYGVGRFTDGPTFPDMRTSLIRMNPANGIPDYTLLGHTSASTAARIYGIDLVIDQDFIYFTSLGDVNGTSIDNTEIFVQKATLDGDIIWLKQYDLPGDNDWVDEIIKSGDGFVVLGRNRVSPSDLFLFKIDTDGNVVWSRKFDYATNDNSVSLGGISSQMVTLGDFIYFTAYAEEAGQYDMILAKVNKDGLVTDSCMTFTPIVIPVKEITERTYYTVEPDVFDFTPQSVDRPLSVGMDVPLTQSNICGGQNTVETHIEAIICEGDTYEGYTQTGVYIDVFQNKSGCDSIRTLMLTVNVCQPDCGSASGNIFGSPFVDEKGNCLATSRENDAVYVAGSIGDSTLLLKVDLTGKMLWSRIIDVIPEESEVPAGIVADADGMIAIVGTGRDQVMGGTIYAFRYNPDTHTLLWSHEYSHSPNDYALGMIEKGKGGNYLLTNQPTFWAQSMQFAEVVEMDKITGVIVPAFAKNYRDHETETLYDLAYHDNFVYGVGRYKNGGSAGTFRNTLVKLDPNTGDQIWVKMGHVSASGTARLYGSDLTFMDNFIFSICSGDPAGTSTNARKIFIQKTDLDGNLSWIKHYEIPGVNDISHDLIYSGNGLIAFTYDQMTGSNYLFKIDVDGNVLWAKTFDFPTLILNTEESRTNTILVQAGDRLVFTGLGINISGDADVLVVQTDLDGNVQSPCVESHSISLTAQTVNNPAWYEQSPEQFNVEFETSDQSPVSRASVIPISQECAVIDTIISYIEAAICEDEVYESYYESGIYSDTFQTSTGCDSIRILTLTVHELIFTQHDKTICFGESFEGHTEPGFYPDTFQVASGCDSISFLHLIVLPICGLSMIYDLDSCRSYMSDGSHMDYSEFVPEYQEMACHPFSGSILHRNPPQENKHSCTEGVNGSIAMCISSLGSCSYLPGDNASAIIELTATTDAQAFIKLEFYEKGPPNYSWIDGTSGLNNYPRYYGIRILKNGVPVFEKHDIPTSPTWSLQAYDFIDLPDFEVNGPTTFRIELLPYCPIGNGASVSAWDLDEIKIYASCEPFEEPNKIIHGYVRDRNDKPLPEAIVSLENENTFAKEFTETDNAGYYEFNHVQDNTAYTIAGNKNGDWLNGVNTLDLVNIQKHILGKQPFTSLDQYLAGDVNQSGNITVMDLLDLRKTILGINPEFPNNTSWRIGICSDLSSLSYSDFIETSLIPQLVEPQLRFDFLAIKIGDVNGDWRQDFQGSMLTSRSDNRYEIEFDDQVVSKGEKIVVPIKAMRDIQLEGIQLMLASSNFELTGIQAGKIPITPEFYAFDQQGALRISWSQAESILISKGDILFTLTFSAHVSGPLSQKFKLLSAVLEPEVYSGGESKPVILTVTPLSEANVSQQVTQVRIEPNPFKSSTTIRFQMTEPGSVRFIFFNLSGQKLYEVQHEYFTGAQSLEIGNAQLPAGDALIYCQIIAEDQIATKKLVKMR